MQSYGETAKTDKIDAKYLSWYGRERHLKLEVYEAIDAKEREIKQLVQYITYLKNARAAQKNRIQSPGCEEIRDLLQSELDSMTAQIAKVERRINELLDDDSDIGNKVKLISQYKGIGEVTAINLAVHLPEIGDSNNQKKLFSLAGLAPRAKDSGKIHGYRTTKIGGRPI